MQDNDPLWKLRHGLAGMSLALLVSVPLAAVLGSWIGGVLGDSYAARASAYTVLLAYVLAGAVVLFVKVARHETRPLTPARLALWLASLWLWPGLWLAAKKPPPPSLPPSPPPSPPPPSPPPP